jgi:nitroimidazol reductase NimA-like FMN-containing flavoprotein (pyridoxamine 5'-phosphate oxidase superfamily)
VAVVLDNAGLEVLDRAECLRLLATAGVGRIAISARAMPVILPVHYVLDGDDIVVRTHRGSTLDLATQGAVVAFEADCVGPGADLAWSVLVTGKARHADEAQMQGDGWSELPVWNASVPESVVLISTDHVSGRRAR